MAGPKITVVGAGSYFFGKQIIHKMASSKIFHGGVLALVDVNESVLLTMKNLADRVFREKGAPVKKLWAERSSQMVGYVIFLLPKGKKESGLLSRHKEQGTDPSDLPTYMPA